MGMRRDDESGFVLIELLMVVLILGVLAGIAFPAMAAQKDKARAAAMKATLRDAATFQESRVATGLRYAAPGPLGLADLVAEGFRTTDGVTLTIIDDEMTGNGGGFCMKAESPGATTLYYASTGGVKKISDTPCVAS